MEKLKIADKWIGNSEPTFIIAEIGVNHNGDVKLARKMIDYASKAKVDAVKFQIFKADELTTSSAPTVRYQRATTGEQNQLNMLKKYELSQNEFQELSDYSLKKDLMFLATPFDIPSLDFLVALNVPALKIGSADLTNTLLLGAAAHTRLPLILSTGMATLGEIENALELVKPSQVALMHCVTAYPAPPDMVNLRVLNTLRSAFQTPIGFSDHTVGIEIACAAVALGAVVIEKHFTLDHGLPGPDHKASITPDELISFVNAIRNVEAALGSSQKQVSPLEKETAKLVRRSIVAKDTIAIDTTLTMDMIALKRPGTGLSSSYIPLILGRKTRTIIRKDELITWETII